MFYKAVKIIFISFSIATISAQKKAANNDKPKLVVGIVVDQMRWDYLYRYEKKYGTDGFKRMLKEGYSLNNVHIPYIPTITAVGHASIYTGSVPSIHGIIGNNWIDKETGRSVYCTADSNVNPVGSDSRKNGSHSPSNLWSTTITDELRMASNFRSKVVGVSLKDRASILPAGHHPTAAFWFDDSTGNFITSSYYMSELPQWVRSFNSENNAEKLLSKGWDTFFPIQEYIESTKDHTEWENPVGSAKIPVFPYSSLMKDYKTDKGVIRTTPFGNTLTLQFAKAALVNYELGKGAETDFLAINLASTDYVGHSYGPNSIEVEDTYIRLDRDLAIFFKELDNKVGKDNYVVFLSADHGGAHSAGYLDSNKMPSGFFDENLQQSLEEELKARFKTEKIILGIDNYQIYLNDEAIIKNRLNQEDVKMNIINKLNKKPEILYAFELAKVALLPVPEPLKYRAISGFNWKRSGDIQIVPKDGMLPNYARKGTTHGAWNSYDSHIPLIFMGWKIKAGENNAAYYMTDIAPTISALLHIQYPSGMVGRPITEVLESK